MNWQARTLLLAAVLAATALTPRAEATNHQTQIDEVMAGAFGRPDIQFVELKMSDCSQNDWAEHKARLVFYDAQGNQVGEFPFLTDPPVNCSVFGQSVLIGTQAYANLPSAPDPDFIIPASIIPNSGKVCFRSGPNSVFPVVLCTSYGNFTGNSEQTSPNNAPALSTREVCALQRVAFFNDFSEPNTNADYALRVPAPRNNAGLAGPVIVPPRFADVPAIHPFFRFCEALFNNGVTAGCGNGNFCPNGTVTRGQMAVFLLRSKEGPTFTPPACTTPLFNDVPCSNPLAPWVNELARRAVTSGCGNGNYCPGSPVTRAQMAVFLLRTLGGPTFTPPPCTTPLFNDVPCSNALAPWINELARRGITGGCGGGNYCPGSSVTRGQMAVFLSATFSLPVPSASCSADLDDHGDQAGTATPLTINAPVTNGSIESAGDVDFFSFFAGAGQQLVIETSGLGPGMDTFLRLFSSDGVTLMAFDDDGAGGLASFIAFTFPHTGTFFAAVTHFDSSSTGTYQVRVRTP
jgi:hypothetical protein